MEVFDGNPVSEAQIWNEVGAKRIRGRFRATLAGLLELEVLRVRHKEMVEMALGTLGSPVESDLMFQRGCPRYLVKDSSSRLKLKRSHSHESVHIGKSRAFVNLEKVGVHHSSGDLQQLDGCSSASSGFCESSFYSCAGNDAINSLPTSLVSLSDSCNVGDGCCFEKVTFIQQQSSLPKNSQEYQNDEIETQTFLKVMIPDAGFLSVINLYPVSRWPDLSDILLPQVVLEPSYLSDLKCCQGSEVYHYPSPLHAVALQSPLYTPLSPTKNRKRNKTHSGFMTLRSSTTTTPECIYGHQASEHSSWNSMNLLKSSTSLNSHASLENDMCTDIVLKRAQGIPSWSKRSVVSLDHTCSVNGSKATFKSVHFQNKAMAQLESEAVSCSTSSRAGFRRLGTHKSRFRRHTAALTNLSIYRKGHGTLCLSTNCYCIGTLDEKDT